MFHACAGVSHNDGGDSGFQPKVHTGVYYQTNTGSKAPKLLFKPVLAGNMKVGADVLMEGGKSSG